MSFMQLIKMALTSIKTNKVRSFLTMLGIVIGVSAVIVLTGLVNGSSSQLTDQIKEFGSNLVVVSINRNSGTRTVDTQQLFEFVDKNRDIVSGVAPVGNSSVTVKYGNTNQATQIEATNEQTEIIRNTKTQLGQFFSKKDVEQRKYVALIGTYLRSELFGEKNPIGEEIKINGTIFTVVGVLEEKQNSTENSTDNRILVPYTVALRVIKNISIRTYYFQAADEKAVNMAVLKIQDFLLRQLGNDKAYTVINQKEIMEIMDKITGIMSGLLAGIAAISLLVGGIGIMNIMLVSVTERTREIGIRKAIGAKRRDILSQFLIESIVVSMLGGIVGIMLGLLAGLLLGKLFNIQFLSTIGTISLSVGFSVGVGVFFGIYPASKASKLSPIEALRYE